ncbi:hypothetical protein [Flavobacterium hibernum]|uniref:hypothetical protein n=1 Tax=Flavobacterium hibernum TaxID=37752 RepID=UPI000B0DD92F|nr:hypothetical protein [Flavobacterium hibernum]STO10702.1 Uncharacterised protein [Flavobacterium hibernum]
MLSEYTEEDIIDMKILNCIKQFENDKEEQLTELVIEILVESILNQCYEESNQISTI